MKKYPEIEEEIITSSGFSNACWEYFYNAIKTNPKLFRRATVEERARKNGVLNLQQRKTPRRL